MLFLLASCGGGGGSSGSGGGGQGVLSVELAFTPGDGRVTVELVRKGPLVGLLNISSYRLTAIDSADEVMRIEGDRLAEETFNGSTLRGLMNDRNYTFALWVFYFPVGSAELSNLSLRIDYAEEANRQNMRDAGGGITIGDNWDRDYLADSVDADDDNDGLDDLDAASGTVLDRCPRGELGWRSNGTTDNDGDGCHDAREDDDDDNDNIPDSEDSGEYNDRQCRLFADCDGDGLMDNEDLGQFNGKPCRVKPDCDDDTIADASDVDIDGDGLIEIGTAAELDAVRWVLNGSGRRLSEGGALDRTGCGNGMAGGAIPECVGYELVRDISLAAYAGGEGWAPLGRDVDSSAVGCQGTVFSGVFDGNGFAVKELNINRSEEDCIGLFGYLAAGTVIRNLAVRAGAVIGGDRVGGLVGDGENAKIVSSSSVAGEVSGGFRVGGLMGLGDRAEIVSSFSIAGEISGGLNAVGGLVGSGLGAEIVSSSSVAGAVSGDTYVGGLVGLGGGLLGGGSNANIASSFSVAGAVSGDVYVGGLVGLGGGLLGSSDANIVSSFSVAGEVSGNSLVGGLVGGNDGSVDSSYWHSAVAVADNGKGENKTLAGLRTPTNDNAYDTGSIYANWTRGADIDDMAGVEDITIYCDEDLSGDIETDEMRDGSMTGENDNRIWDFGGTGDYPAIRCLPLSLAAQRSWWFINSTGHPNVNRTRLDALTSP